MAHKSDARTVSETVATEPAREVNKRFAIDLARAFGGAIMFSLPMLMTMEM